MRFQNFHKIQSGIATGALLSALSERPELWNEITARQTTPGSPHVDTKSIFLRWCESRDLASVFTQIPAVDYPAYSLLPEARQLVAFLHDVTGGQELGRALIVSLAPGGSILEHIDEGAYADHYERFHICLKSEVGNLFWSGNPNSGFEAVHMEPGEAWWFNHKETHWVTNESCDERIHLIVDCVAPMYRRERHAISA